MTRDKRRLSCGEKCLQSLRRMRRFPGHMFELFLVFLRLNKLVDEALPTESAERGPSNVTKVDFRRGSSNKPDETRSDWREFRLAVTVMAAVMGSAAYLGYLVLSHLHADSTGLIHQTGANESRTEKLQDGTLMTLGARSKVQEHFSAKRRGVQHLGGEAKFDVAPDTTKRPFVVSTFLVDVIGGTKFSVVVDTTVTVTAHEGVVRVLAPGAKPGSMGSSVRPGESYRVPVDGFRAVVADDGVSGARMQRSSS
jgi:ferric-dicitrate binding protein FerR (iron transport regulator)